MPKTYTGCSGFYYRHWRSTFYPDDLPQHLWFEYYCGFFNTLELNTTFYNFPKLSALQSWYQRSPENFIFTVKAPRLITHFKQFHDVTGVISDFYGTVLEGLLEKLGCILFQLPPHLEYQEERLERIIEAMDPAFNNVIEFRHESWWTSFVKNKLAENKITFCGISHPTLPDEVIIYNSPAYYRFHGVPHLYRSFYDEKFLKQIADKFLENKISEAYFYFNNDVNAHALENAKWLKDYFALRMDEDFI